ncbi:hypothetical protein [Streptomyces sp. NPDC059389]|uniref:hypothetical protein n=1 Tax=Streptomyces sp. NPDC059389 TaxID=3346818 RepID=UPI00368C1075
MARVRAARQAPCAAGRRAEADEAVPERAARVGPGADLPARRPHEVGDGRLQRACPARASVPRPRRLVCDETTAMEGASTAAALVGVVEECRAETGAGLLAVGRDPFPLTRRRDRTTHRDGIVKH